jgi:hypothetical protein
MRALGRLLVVLSLSIVFCCGCKSQTQAPVQLTTINGPQGGRIRYGVVPGATTQAAAITKLLSTIHTDCGEKPQIGKPFQFQGSNSVGVFFTVTDHPDGNIPLAGLVIANATGSKQMDGAMVFDEASRFGSTANPLLQQLSGLWNQGPAPTSSGTTAGASPAPAVATGAVGGMQKYALPDGTASVSMPAGWKVDPQSGGGGMRIYGPHGEVAILDNMFLAEDPSVLRSGMKPLKGMIVYPSNFDLVKSFADIIQQFRRSNNMGPAPIKIDTVEQVAPPQDAAVQGERCAQATGQVNPDGKGMQGMFRVICVNPAHQGLYSFLDSSVEFPLSEAGQMNAIAPAILGSFQVNMALITQRATAQSAPFIAHLKQVDAQQRQANQAFTANAVNNIHAIGAAATARMNTTEAANSAEQASWNAGQNANAKNAQGFSNYLLDQSVVQKNSTGGHQTDWNSTAEALVKSNPSRYQYVDTPNYIKGTDY